MAQGDVFARGESNHGAVELDWGFVRQVLIASLNPIDLLEGSVHFSFRVDDLYHERGLSSIELIVVVNSDVVCIAVFFQKSSDARIELVEMFFLEELESHSNVVSKRIVLTVVVHEYLNLISDVFSDCLDIDRFQIDVIEKEIAD